MDKGLAETVAQLFRPQAPLWACEFTSEQIIIAGVNARRTKIEGRIASPMPRGENIAAARPLLRELVSRSGFKGSEIAVVVPDEMARISFLTAEKPSKNPDEQRTFIRWKLKKSIPFDVDNAQVAYNIIGPSRSGTGVDMIVALSPRSVVQEYEKLFDSMDIHAGIVLPSTLAVLNLLEVPAADMLFLKVSSDCMTTTVFQNRRVQFYRRVTDVSLYDAIYPTILYYQDKLGGKDLTQLYVCGYGTDLREELEEIYEKLGLAPKRVEPRDVDDLLKPALGAIHLKPQVAAVNA